MDIKDLQQTLRHDPLRDMKQQNQRRSLQPDLKTDIKNFDLNKPPGPDRAVMSNQERLKEFIDARRQSLSNEFNKLLFRIPEEYRFVVEIIVIGIFVSFFTLMFYRQQHRRMEREKEAQSATEEKREQTLWKT